MCSTCCYPVQSKVPTLLFDSQLPPLVLQGPRMVRDVFRLAKENAPAIIFIDEVDAIATARFDAQTGADREVQRILMELLNQMDGFDQTVNVKVCPGCGVQYNSTNMQLTFA